LTLVQCLRDGDPGAADLLDRLYRDALLRYCWGYLGSMEEAEDALQEVWYRVFTAAHVPDRFRPWLYKIARNRCFNILRAKARRREGTGLPADSQLAASLTGHLTKMVNEEMRSRMSHLVESLPDAQREVLRLRYVEGLSRTEIAEVVDIPESVVKSRLFEGLKRLREQVQSSEGA